MSLREGDLSVLFLVLRNYKKEKTLGGGFFFYVTAQVNVDNHDDNDQVREERNAVS